MKKYTQEPITNEFGLNCEGYRRPDDSTHAPHNERATVRVSWKLNAGRMSKNLCTEGAADFMKAWEGAQ